MKLIDLEISNFKSIVKPQKVSFNDHFVMVVGKNGSGKSNFLQGIAAFFSLISGKNLYKGAKYRVRVEIDEEELNKISFANLAIRKKHIITLCFDDDSVQKIKLYFHRHEFIYLDANSELYKEILELLNHKCVLLDYEHFVFNKEQGERFFQELFFNVCEENKLIDKGASHRIEDYSHDFIESLFLKFGDVLKETSPLFPSFYEHIRLAIVDNIIQCFVVDFDGKERSIVDTNVGRRWETFYLMLRHQLKEGDIFLIDEPAAFLHPEAQTNVLKDMEWMMKEKKIIVIYATHSPYMLSEHFPCFYYAEMTNQGTLVKRHLIKDMPYIRDQMRFLDLNTIILNFNRTYLLVEGQSDVACFKKFMEYFHVDLTKYEILQIDGAGNMKSITHFLDKNNRKYIRILDADQKPYHSAQEQIVYVGEEYEEKRLEGLFSNADRKRYFKGVKVDASKVQKGRIFTSTTVKNFMNLFNKIGII